jgi:hypothetical protein
MIICGSCYKGLLDLRIDHSASPISDPVIVKCEKCDASTSLISVMIRPPRWWDANSLRNRAQVLIVQAEILELELNTDVDQRESN